MPLLMHFNKDISSNSKLTTQTCLYYFIFAIGTPLHVINTTQPLPGFSHPEAKRLAVRLRGCQMMLFCGGWFNSAVSEGRGATPKSKLESRHHRGRLNWNGI